MPLRLVAGRAIFAPTSLTLPLTSLASPTWTHSHLPKRHFHRSPVQRSEFSKQNHYERLGLRHDASSGEIKKSFYSLSKSHHPDVNPSPAASQNFSLLSESYKILSDPSRRAQYDRDVLRLHQQQHHHTAHHGSYHSQQAGGRSPSGLSKRRGSFRGPPTSFYRSGGWGAHSEKRRKAHEESTGSSAGASTGPSTGSKQDAWSHGGMGPGSNPFGAKRTDDEVPHFDREGHTRTHQRQDDRRYERRRAMGDDDVEFEPQTSLTGHFFIVMGILAATFVAPLVYLQFMRLGRRKREGV